MINPSSPEFTHHPATAFRVRIGGSHRTEADVRKFFADRRVIAATRLLPGGIDVHVAVALDGEGHVLLADHGGGVYPGQEDMELLVELGATLECAVISEGVSSYADANGKLPAFIEEDMSNDVREVLFWRHDPQDAARIQAISDLVAEPIDYAVSGQWTLASTGLDGVWLEDVLDNAGDKIALDAGQFPLVTLVRSNQHRVLIWQPAPYVDSLAIMHIAELSPVLPRAETGVVSNSAAEVTERLRYPGYAPEEIATSVFPVEFSAEQTAELLATSTLPEDEFFSRALALLDLPTAAVDAIEANPAPKNSENVDDNTIAAWLPIPGAIRLLPTPRKPWYARFTGAGKR